MPANFTAADLLATSFAFVLFSLFAFIPGYVLSAGFDLFGFRRRRLAAKLAIAVPASIAACPAVTYLAWRWSPNAVWWLYGTCWLAFAVLAFRHRSRLIVSRRVVILAAIAGGWIVVGMLSSIDLQIGKRLYFPTVSYDYMLRTAITSSITRSGVPPDNPYFHPAGHAFPLRYHYFWFLPCSLVDQLGGSLVSARQAVIAGTLWCGIGLMAMVPLYLRFFQPKGPADLERRTLAGIALLGITGLDIAPTALLSALRGGVIESVEWWNSPVMGWVHAVLWVPHHIAGLIACLTGFLTVYYSFHQRDATIRSRAMPSIAAGVMFASAAGLSIYVTLVFAAAVAFLIAVLLAKRYRVEAASLVLAGCVALAVAAPYLTALSGGGGGAAAGGASVEAVATTGPILQFAVRPFLLVDRIVRAIWPDQPWLVPAADLLLLPLHYFLELGLFAVVGIVMFQRLRRTRPLPLPGLAALTIGIVSVLICTFLRSSVIANNDLGWRGFLVAQFMLLIWAAELWDEGFFTAHARQGLIGTLLLFGAAGTMYEVAMVRFYTMISDDFAVPRDEWFPADHHLGERTYAMRELYEGLQHRLPITAVLQHNPDQPIGDVFHGLYSDRQTAVETPGCGVVFGGDASLCDTVMPSIATVFDRSKALSWTQVEATCRDAAIDAVVVKDRDRIWAAGDSWVWTEQPVFANDRSRAFLCRTTASRESALLR